MMRQLDKLRLRLRSLFFTSRADRDLARELRAHVDEEAAANIAAGMPPHEARAAAARAFGSAVLVEEQCRDTRRVALVSNLARDVRYALRGFARQPGLFAAAVASISLGIGAILTIFSLANSLLMAAPSASDPHSLVVIRMDNGSHVSYGAWRALHERGVLGGLAGYRFEQSVNWRNGDESTTLLPLLVTANFFDMLRVPFSSGRGFTAAEAAAERHPRLVVVSYGFWQRSLAADPHAVGRTLTINGEAYTITGVLQRGLRSVTGFGISPEVYLPLSQELYPIDQPRSGAAQLIGRLKPGQSVESGRAALDAAAGQMARAEAKPEFKRVAEFASVGGLAQVVDLPGVGAFFAVLLAMSGLVLAIACANVASLLLARGLVRRREMAMRVALGASRGRLVQQLFAESLVVALAGTAAGAVLTALAFIGLSNVALPVPIPLELHLSLDWRVLSLALFVVIFATCATGTAPAFQSTRRAVIGSIKAEERYVISRRLTVRSALLVGQVAVSVVLLVAALLFARSLMRAGSIDPGFDVDRLLVAQVSFVEGRQGPRERPSIEQVIARVRAVPGVEAASFSQGVPLTVFSGSSTGTDMRIEGRESAVRVDYDGNRVGPGYFTSMGIRLHRGRDFSTEDRVGAPPVVIVNEEFARRYFPGEDPLGRRILDPERKDSTVQIVGVVSNGKYHTLAGSDRPAVYEPALADPTPDRLMHIVVRGSARPETLMASVRRAVLDADGSASVTLTPMRQAIAFAVVPSRMGSMFLGLMGGFGVVLAMVGLFGAVSFAVSRRIREIAVRLALGASRGQVLTLVLRSAGVLVLSGVAAGLAVAWLITAPLAAFLVSGISATDPLSFAGAAAVLIVASLAAIWAPAARAIRVAPATALKVE
jgi:predicted permease